MYNPSLLFTNEIQSNYIDYIQIEEYNSSWSIEGFKYSLLINIPRNLIQSIFEVNYSNYPNIPPSGYYEANLAGPRDYLRDDDIYPESIDYKEFYRYTDNDLATENGTELHEYNLSSYLELKVIKSSTVIHTLKIGIPLKESIHNFYINNELTANPYIYDLTRDEITSESLVLFPNYLLANENHNSLEHITQTGFLNRIVIHDLDSSDFELTLIINNVSISKTTSKVALNYFPLVNYLSPTNQIDASYALYLIKHSRPNDYKTISSSYLRHLLSYNLTLPPSILSTSSTTNQINNFSIYELAFTTLAILVNLSSINESVNDGVYSFIQRNLNIITASVNYNTGLCYLYKDIEDNYTTSNSIETSCIVSLVLDLSLDFNYNSITEYYSYILKKKIREIIELDYIETYDPVEKLNILYHLLIWVESNSELNYLEKIKDLTLKSIQEDTFNDPEDLLKISYITYRLDSTIGLSINLDAYEITNILTEYEPDLWGLGTYNLRHTSLKYIITNGLLIAPSVNNTNKYREVETYIHNLLTRSYKYIPLGEPWIDLDKLDSAKGYVGAIFKALSYNLLPLAFEYICLNYSLNIDTAYGVGLDRWGIFLQIPRSKGELDINYKLRLQAILSIQDLTTNSIETYINTIKREINTEIINIPPPQEILIDDVSTVVTIDELVELINNEDSIYLTDGTLYEPNRNLGVLNINSYESRLINSMFLLLKDKYNMVVILNTNSSYTVN